MTAADHLRAIRDHRRRLLELATDDLERSRELRRRTDGAGISQDALNAAERAVELAAVDLEKAQADVDATEAKGE